MTANDAAARRSVADRGWPAACWRWLVEDWNWPAAGLSPAEKQEPMLFLASRLRAEGATLAEPRTFAPDEMAGWIAEDEADMRRLRARP